jgi:hypothetical protein
MREGKWQPSLGLLLNIDAEVRGLCHASRCLESAPRSALLLGDECLHKVSEWLSADG